MPGTYENTCMVMEAGNSNFLNSLSMTIVCVRIAELKDEEVLTVPLAYTTLLVQGMVAAT